MPSQELFDKVYSERAIVIKLLCSLAAKLGYDYGKGIDDNETWETEWRNVVYVQLPEGQYSWHISPQDLHLFEGVKQFGGKWDGTFLGRDKEFAEKIVVSSWPKHGILRCNGVCDKGIDDIFLCDDNEKE